MDRFTEQAKRGSDAGKALRLKTLAEGNPFMINTLDTGHPCYLEYPDGKICQVELMPSKRDFHIIRSLTIDEAQNLRARFIFTE